MDNASSISSGADLATKYHKLATEYAKLRAQLPVLKKAVTDEQARNIQLGEDVRTKDLSLRKHEQEVESLSFRNQQLSKRVQVLQDRLDEMQTSMIRASRRGRRKSIDINVPTNTGSAVHGGINNANNVIAEELQNKLRQNEELHKQVFDIEQSCNDKMRELRRRLDEVEQDRTSAIQQLGTIRSKHQAVIDVLKVEKSDLQERLDSVQDELLETKSLLKNSRPRGDTRASRSYSIRTLVESIPDGADDHLANLDVPQLDSSLKTQSADIYQILSDEFGHLMIHWGNFHSYCQQRSKLYPCDASMEPITATCTQLGKLLSNSSDHVKPLASALEVLCQKGLSDPAFMLLSDLQPVISSFVGYVAYFGKVCPVLTKSYDEECDVSWCSPRLDQDNRAFLGSLSKFLSCLCSVRCTLEALSGDGIVKNNQSISSTFDSIASGLDDLWKCANDLSDAFSLKVTSEHQLPTATKKLKTTNECILASLHNFSTAMRKITDTFRENSQFFDWHLNSMINAVPVIKDFANEAELYMSLISAKHVTIEPSLSTYSFNADNAGALLTDGDRVEMLESKLTEKNQKILELEREREHWMLEAQLLQVKADDGIEPGYGDGDGTTNETSPTTGSTNNSHLITEHYDQRVSDLISDVQVSDSRNMYFAQECLNLVTSLKLCRRQHEKLQDEFRSAKETSSSLKEELETTRSGYESQLNTLSEHLAELNQRLTRQTDEIELLKRTKNEKVQKKGLFGKQ